MPLAIGQKAIHTVLETHTDWTIPQVAKITTQKGTGALFAKDKLVKHRFSEYNFMIIIIINNNMIPKSGLRINTL